MDSLNAFNRFREFLESHPNIKVIDSLENATSLLTRGEMYKKIQSAVGDGATVNGIRLRLPWQIDVEKINDQTSGLVLEEMASSHVNFPILIKTDQASVSSNSHFMCVVFDAEGLVQALSMFNEKLIIQEYINHDKTVYKVYTIGEDIKYFPRPSCSNLVSGTSMVSFRSDHPWPDGLKSIDEQIIRELDMEIVRHGAKLITESLKITIFGYDVLVQSNTLDHVIVDLNVFPGFKEYPSLSAVMDQHIINVFRNNY